VCLITQQEKEYYLRPRAIRENTFSKGLSMSIYQWKRKEKKNKGIGNYFLQLKEKVVSNYLLLYRQ